MPLKIVISGATGMVGRTLTDHFSKQGHKVTPLLRSSSQDGLEGINWDINAGTIEQQKLEDQDVVIHLAGANISKRWTPEYKRLIKSSRVDSTRLLSGALVNLKKKPRLFISASAIGYYGNHSSHVTLNENSAMGVGFLSEVCCQWENETRRAVDAGIRVVNMRLGVVLAKEGGALAKMLLIFDLGLGGILGSGSQMMSWVSLKEIPMIIDHIICTESLTGPINVVAPKAVTNREFTRALGEVMKRPIIFPVPAFGIKILFGEMGKELLLEGAHVVPQKLQSSGYIFKYPDVKSALNNALSSS